MMNMVLIPEEEYNVISKKIDNILDYLTYQKKSDERLINTEELLLSVPVCRRTLQKYRDRGLIRFTKRGRKVLYSRQEVIEDLKGIRKN
jgi:predicted transcriptional regulator